MKTPALKMLVILVTACSVLLGSVVGPYQRAQTVQAAFVIDDVTLFVITLLAMSGIYVSYSYFQDSSAAEELVDNFDEEYQEQRFKVLAGGAGAPDPGDEDPDKIPKDVNELMASTMGPNRIITLGALASLNLTTWVIQKAVEFGFFDFIFGDNVENTDQYSLYNLPPDCAPIKIGLSDYGITDKDFLNRYKSYFNQVGSTAVFYASSALNGKAFVARSYGTTAGVYNAVLVDLDSENYSVYGYNPALDPALQGNVQVSLRNLNESSWILSNATVQMGLKGGIVLTRSGNPNTDILNGTLLVSPEIPVYIRQNGEITNVADSIIWTTPELQNNFDEHGTITVPTVPSTDLSVVTPAALQALQDAMNQANQLEDPYRDPAIDSAINNFTQTITDPKPSPDPSPDPSEDLENSLTTEQKGLFLLPDWIKDRFPFCVPFDMVEAFQHLSGAGRDAPSFEWRLYAPQYGIDYTFEIDLDVFDQAAAILRNLLLILFIISLAAGTRWLIRG